MDDDERDRSELVPLVAMINLLFLRPPLRSFLHVAAAVVQPVDARHGIRGQFLDDDPFLIHFLDDRRVRFSVQILLQVDLFVGDFLVLVAGGSFEKAVDDLGIRR